MATNETFVEVHTNEEWLDDEEYEEEEMPKEVVVENKEQGIDVLRAEILKAPMEERITHGLVIENLDETKLSSIWKQNRPCYGEMRRYGKESTRPQDLKPGDLTMPIGFKYSVKAVGIPFLFAAGVYTIDGYKKLPPEGRKEAAELLVDIFYNPQGPYKAVGETEIVRTEDGIPRGVIYKTGEVDPTLIVGQAIGARYLTSLLSSSERIRAFIKEFRDHPALAILLLKQLQHRIPNIYAKTPESFTYNTNSSSDYWLFRCLNIKNFLAGTPAQNLAKGTFEEGFDYNRPWLPLAFTATQDPSGSLTYPTNEDFPSDVSRFKALFAELGVSSNGSGGFHADSILEKKDEIVNAVYNWS